jgi:hypothetical protein
MSAFPFGESRQRIICQFGWRILTYGRTLYLLLCGGDKGRHQERARNVERIESAVQKTGQEKVIMAGKSKRRKIKLSP